MLVTGRCPADGVVELTVCDLQTVVVRSGSDVEATFACPRCGSPITFSASRGAAATLAALTSAPERRLSLAPRGPREAASAITPMRREADQPLVEAYVEYFRREIEDAPTFSEVMGAMGAPAEDVR